jgi:hypothetical protein
MHRHSTTLNSIMNQTYWLCLSVLTAALVLLLVHVARAQTPEDPHNRVVIIVDGSGSYKARQAEAVERAVTLLEGMAQTKLHRWEPATDSVSLISLDAIPEVLWQGTLQDLKKLDRAAWTGRFRARTDYAKCTDVSAAFRLAAQQLEGDSRSVSKYLFVFSDLIHEPPTTSIAACQRPKRPSLPPNDFPWGALQDVSVAVFWLPPDQKLAWRRVVEEHGLTTNFALYSASESMEVTIATPPRPTLAVTEAERQAERDRYLGYGTTLVKGIGAILGLVALSVLVGVPAVRLWQRRRQPPQPPATGNGRPLPMSIRRPGAPVPPNGPRPLDPRLSESPSARRQ